MSATTGARRSLGVEWHLPTRTGGYAKRPFTTTTRADSDGIALLAADGLTWAQIKVALHYPSDEQTVVIERFIAEGHGDSRVSLFVA